MIFLIDTQKVNNLVKSDNYHNVKEQAIRTKRRKETNSNYKKKNKYKLEILYNIDGQY